MAGGGGRGGGEIGRRAESRKPLAITDPARNPQSPTGIPQRRRFWAEKRNSKAHGPRGFFARFAVAKKKPGNKAFWLVEWSAVADNPLGGSRTKGGQKCEIFVPKWFGEKELRCFRCGRQFRGKFLESSLINLRRRPPRRVARETACFEAFCESREKSFRVVSPIVIVFIVMVYHDNCREGKLS